MTVVSSMMIGAIATMMVHCGTMTWSTPPAIRITMDMGVATTGSTPPTWWIIMRIATAWTTSPTRWIIVNPLIFRCFFFCHLCAICVLLKIFGAFSALDLKKLQSYILILLEGSTHLIQLTSLRGLTANHREDLGQEPCDENTTHLVALFPLNHWLEEKLSEQRGFCPDRNCNLRVQRPAGTMRSLILTRWNENACHWCNLTKNQKHANILVKYGEMNLDNPQEAQSLSFEEFSLWYLGIITSSFHHNCVFLSNYPLWQAVLWSFMCVWQISLKSPFAWNTSKLSVGFQSSSNKHINNSFLVKLYHFPPSFVVKFGKTHLENNQEPEGSFHLLKAKPSMSLHPFLCCHFLVWPRVMKVNMPQVLRVKFCWDELILWEPERIEILPRKLTC